MSGARRFYFDPDAMAAATSLPASPADGGRERTSLAEVTLSQPEKQKSQQWSQITKALSLRMPSENCAIGPRANSRVKSPSRGGRQMDFDIRNINVIVLDRPTSSTVFISWKDATRCNYGYQLWHLAKSRKSGICALSSKPIKVGDVVYRPYSGRSNPLNGGAMILAVSIYERSPNVSVFETSEEKCLAGFKAQVQHV